MRMLRYVTPVLMLSSSLFADGGPKIGGLFRGELIYNNNRTREGAGVSSGSLATTSQQAYANFTASGSISDKIKYESEVQFINNGELSGNSLIGLPSNCMGSPIKTAQTTWWQSDMFSFGIGCSKVKSGGWDFANYNEATTLRAINPVINQTNKGDPTFSYVPNMKSYNPTLEVGFHMFGDLTLQLMNDVNPGNWQTKQQQTWNLEWKGDIVGIRPIVQYGAYDGGHSSHFDVGLMLDVAGFGITADYMMVAHSQKLPNSAGTGSTSKLDNGTRFSAQIDYEMKKMMTATLYYSNYKNKLHTADPGANSTAGTWDHEGQILSLAAAATSFSSNYSPYIALDMQTGKFLQGIDKKTKSDLIVRVGAAAHF